MTTVLQRESLAQASACFDGEMLSISTGTVERRWQAVPSGLRTLSFRHTDGSREWIAGGSSTCDWQLAGVLDEGLHCRLGEVQMRQVLQALHTTDHLEVEVPLLYDDVGFEVRYRIWVYPGADGVRTQLRVRALRELDRTRLPSYLGPSYADRLRLANPLTPALAVGYYNDTQHRNCDWLPILKEQGVEVARGETVDWASVLHLQGTTECLTLVKESHKCVNQPGIDTGEFVVRPSEVIVTGLGLTPNHYGSARYSWFRTGAFRDCWATWSILTKGGMEQARQGLKTFDRTRYPFRPERDRLIMSNTWGSRGAGEGSRTAAEQSNVLRELESCADLGIDILQIDDGWQCEPGTAKFHDIDWTPDPTRWPDGWRAVRAAGQRLGVKLGLWQPWWTPIDAIVRNHELGGFRRFKIDFMGLHCHDDIEKALGIARELIEATSPDCGINWDATEVSARMGYYLGRDYGNIYLANRPARTAEQVTGRHVAYIPRLMLRDAWHLAKYMNLNQIQLTIQNVDRVDPAFSDAHRHRHDYCFAITMMGVPIFFQETHLYAEEARAQLRPAVALYKQHRDRLMEGFVEPIGDEPCGAGWTGFHSAHPDDTGGYMTIFREIDCDLPEKTMSVAALAGKSLRLIDLVRGSSRDVRVDEDGAIRFAITEPGDYLFLQYLL